MSVGIRTSTMSRVQLSGDFFMARHPVLDRNGLLVGHELVFHPAEAGLRDDPSPPAPAARATGISIIEDLGRQGIARLFGELPAVVRVDEATLMSEAILRLPVNLVLLEPALGPAPDAAVAARIDELAAAGYRYVRRAGDDPGPDGFAAPVAAVRIDTGGKDEQALHDEVASYRRAGTRLCAVSVDTREQYRRCAALHFDSFQGYFFAEPEVQQGKRFEPSQQAIVELLALIASDADEAVLEHALKADVPLSLHLLRLANAPAFTAHPIHSLHQALLALGRDQLQRWLHMLLYSDAAGHGVPAQALGALAAARGRLMELTAQALMPGSRGMADTAFTVGIMSLMDSLFGMPMEDILRELAVVEEVRDALLSRQGFHGSLLQLAIEAERLRQPARLQAAAAALRLSCSDLVMLQLAAWEWSDHVGHLLRSPN